MAVSRHLIPLCLGLKHLKHLKIDFEWMPDRSVIAFMDILQDMAMLESLEFSVLQIYDIHYNTTTAELEE